MGTNRGQRCRARLIAGLLVVTLAATFTPCCELLAGTGAAPDAPQADDRAADHPGASHGHERAPDQVCQTSFDATLTLQPDLMVGVAATVVATPVSFGGVVEPPAADHRAAAWPRAAGPPLYLRFAHLLI